MIKKTNKYLNKKVEAYWLKFDSKVESEFYEYLLSLKAKEIKVHPTYLLQEKFSTSSWNIMAITYKADFEVQFDNWELRVVDIKWLATEVAKIKRKLFMKKYPDMDLKRLVKYNGNFVDYFENEKRKQENRKIRRNSNLQLV